MALKSIVVELVKPTGKRLIGRPRRRWQDNVRKDNKEIGIRTRNLFNSAKDRGNLENVRL